jgi:3-oxoacyl-[acyl-carrier-protein] synthase II
MVELAISLLALPNGVIPPTLNYDIPDPDCPVNVVTEMQPIDRPAFIALNHNASGQAAAVVVCAS